MATNFLRQFSLQNTRPFRFCTNNCHWSSIRSFAFSPAALSPPPQHPQVQYASNAAASVAEAEMAHAEKPQPAETVTGQQRRPIEQRKLDLSEENQQKQIGKGKSNGELLRSMFVLGCCQSNWIVRHNQKLLRWSQAMLGKRMFDKLMRNTFYGQFVAGETVEEVTKTVADLRKFGVNCILEYSVEADIAEEETSQEAAESFEMEKVEEIPKTSTNAEISTNPIRHNKQIGDKSVSELVFQTRNQFSVHDESGNILCAKTIQNAISKECDKNAEIFCHCIDSTAAATKSTGFTAIKITALGNPHLLMKLTGSIALMEKLFKVLSGSSWENLVEKRISEDQLLQRLTEFGVIVDEQRICDWFSRKDTDKDGQIDFFDWSRLLEMNVDELQKIFKISNSKTGKLEPVLNNLTEAEMVELNNMMGRLIKVADHAMSKGVRLLVDAEQTYLQLAISKLAIAMMRRYNRDRCVILNTYQAYLKNTRANLIIDMQIARRDNFHFGCKLVRGAYINQERLRAATIGYQDPTHPSREATSENYHRCLSDIVGEWANRGWGSVSLMAATHNVDSVHYAVDLMKMHGISASDRVVCFGQLYGMYNWLTFALAEAGFSVYKCLPYGSIEDVLPYLSRRALENGAILQNVGKEQRLMRAELRRRATTV